MEMENSKLADQTNNVDDNENNWRKGDVVVFPWKSRRFVREDSKSFHFYFSSTFVCIREADDKHRGILLRVLERTSKSDLLIVGNELYRKDERNNSVDRKRYYGFRFPSTKSLKTALEILRKEPELMSLLQQESMSFHLDSKFWVREPGRRLFFLKTPQYYDSRTDTLHCAEDGASYRRLTMVYFQKGNLFF